MSPERVQHEDEKADEINQATGGLVGYAERRRLKGERIAKEEAEKMAKLRSPGPRHPKATEPAQS